MRHGVLWILTASVMSLTACGGGGGTTSGEPSLPAQKNTPAPPAKRALPAPPAVVCFVERLKKEGKSVNQIKVAATSEHVGPLHIGLSSVAVLKLLGEPVSKSAPSEEAASGETISTWKWPARGVVLTMVHGTKGKIDVRDIDVRAPFKGKTTCGVGVGTDFEAARKIYAPYLASDGGNSADSITVGSIYGGVLITKSRAGLVESISVGAFAE